MVSWTVSGAPPASPVVGVTVFEMSSTGMTTLTFGAEAVSDPVPVW